MSSFFNIIKRLQLQFTISCDGYTIINGDLDLRGTGVTYLPERLVVGGSLLMSGCPIAILPMDLTVFHDLDLSLSHITSIPADLKLLGTLSLENSRVVTLPAGLELFYGLDLENTPLNSLPVNLNVGGYLNLKGTNVTALPNDLMVGGHLLLDAKKFTTNLAYRTLAYDEVPPVSGVEDKLTLIAGPPEEHTFSVFASWVCDEIRVYTPHFFGTPQEFRQVLAPEVVKRKVAECVDELKKKLG